MSESTQIPGNTEQDGFVACTGDDAIVCFCYRKSLGDIKELRAKHGSLKCVQEATNVGNACRGCRVVLQTLFNESIHDENTDKANDPNLFSCVKPGQRLMTALVVANDQLESRIVSSNGVAPQLGGCDSSTPVGFSLLDSQGRVILSREQNLKTGETFCFDTRHENIPRPFLGMFALALGRSNFGGARFNVQWIGSGSVCSTHENYITGRPRVQLPFLFVPAFFEAVNDLFFGLTNPQQEPIGVRIRVTPIEGGEDLLLHRELTRFGSAWIDVKKDLLPLITQQITSTGAAPDSRYAVRFETDGLGAKGSAVVNIFFYNRHTNHWTCQHL